MALGTDQLAELRDELIKARARGARVVQIGEERIEYRSDAEMRDAIGDLEARIKRASGTRPNAVMFSSSKGLG